MSFRDKVIENELDLSLNQLTVVPVKELAATPKATFLDLSNNSIQFLPNDFATLTHLISIDLSHNKLTELPHNFGNLINLERLELDKNLLTDLPVSFCKLKHLSWLDLKDNPLNPKLQAIAGDCLNAQQCELCAKKVVSYMQSIESNLERDKQKKLKEKREREAIEKARMEKELEEQRRLKKIEKERRKAESKARQEEKSKNQNRQNLERDSSHSETDREEADRVAVEKKGISWCRWLLVLLIIAVGGAIYIFASAPNSHLKYFSKKDVQILANLVGSEITRIISNAWKFILPYAIQAKIVILSQIHGIMLYVSQLATDIEVLLSDYF